MAALPSQLNTYTRGIWRKKQVLHATSGTLALIFWGGVLFLAGMLVDWLTFMPTPGRVGLFAVMLAGALTMAWRRGWKNLCVYNARNTALQIEDSLGGRGSLLVTAVQLGGAADAAGASPAMLAHTVNRAEGEIGQLCHKQVVSFRGLKRPLTRFLILSLMLIIFACVSLNFLGAGMARLLPPWRSVKYPTRTTIALKSGDRIIKEGEQALLLADIHGVIPKTAKITLRPAIGKSFTRKVPVNKGVLKYEINAAYLSFKYRVFAGDDRTDWHTVTVIAAPRVTQADVTLTYPDYIQKPSETIDALTLTLPEGTAIKWVLHLDRPVSEARATFTGRDTEDLTVSDDGLRVTMNAVADSSCSYTFHWREKSKGFLFTSPSNYLQVKPDDAPRVELTKPGKNVFATLGRKLDFAYRARDDHGIGEATIRYRVNKVQEQAVSIPPPKPGEQGDVSVDWDYRAVLDSLAIGDTVSFVIDVADRYPAAEGGPHHMRSQVRRLSLLSKNDYLTRMYRQKVRLLTIVKNIYREERGIHQLIKAFKPTSDTFIQTCQLEVVRQELMRDRLLKIKQRMADLVKDLAANNFTEERYTGELTRLQADLQRIADDHVRLVSTKLKALATAAADSSKPVDTTEAIDTANFAARELGIMVLQLGFDEATEVMAREIHTIAEDQATLRWKTITATAASPANRTEVAKRQKDLADWLERLLESVPRDRESTERDALVAFKLSRFRKELTRASTAPRMREAADSIGQTPTEETAAMQADVIKTLLHAEFRLRRGLEYAALTKAESLFNDLANAQKKLREAIDEMTPGTFKTRQSDVKQAQKILSKKLALLLMPAVPAPRYHLLEAIRPPKPDVATFLAASVKAQTRVAAAIDAGDRDQAMANLAKAETAFSALERIARQRLDQLAETQRVAATAAAAGNRMSKIAAFAEQLSSILEKTEDAQAYKTDTAFIIPILERLVKDLNGFKQGVIQKDKRIGARQQLGNPFLTYIDQAVHLLRQAARDLENKKVAEAVTSQEKAATIFDQMVDFLTRKGEDTNAFSTALSMNRMIHDPKDLMQDIQSEQYDMVKIAKAVKDDALPGLAIAQKNLIHAVNAVLSYLDPFAHHIETGSVMLFAKDDMNSAAEALADKDRDEALDAGSYVGESLQGIIDQLSVLAPEYTYVMELVEFIHNRLDGSVAIQALQKQLSADCAVTTAKTDLPSLINRQQTLLARSKMDSRELMTVTGMHALVAHIGFMEAALTHLRDADTVSAAAKMNLAVAALSSENETLLRLNALAVLVLAPCPTPVAPPEFSFLVDFTEMASQQKGLYRTASQATPKDAAALATRQEKLAGQCDLFIQRYTGLEEQYVAKKAAKIKADYARLRNPATPLNEALASDMKKLRAFFTGSMTQLTAARKSMTQASEELKNGVIKEAITAQRDVTGQLRGFYLKNILMFMTEPGPPPPADPVPSFSISTVDAFNVFTPGAVTGQVIKGGKQEWQVLGRRDRAALNENFARELPLEFRGLLKNYYERLAQ